MMMRAGAVAGRRVSWETAGDVVSFCIPTQALRLEKYSLCVCVCADGEIVVETELPGKEFSEDLN